MITIGEHKGNGHRYTNHRITKCYCCFALVRHEEKLNEIKALEHRGSPSYPPTPLVRNVSP